MESRLATTLDAHVGRLREAARASVMSREALRSVSTPASQRALLRSVGLHGLDAAGEPLAAAVVERAAEAGIAGTPDGILMALAGAAAARGIGPREIGLATAAGSVDLAAEDVLLQDPARAAMARQQSAEWRTDADARIDANRTARHELADALGRPPAPWLAARVRAFDLAAASSEVDALVAAGADVLVVLVPRGREVPSGSDEGVAERLPANLEPPPTGSQRGLARLRAALDELAVERRAYVQLGTTSEPLAAPEQALVAALERVDLVFADPFDELVMGVDLDRALADHAVAHGLLSRSGATLVLSAGPLLAGPELRRGEDITAPTRAARSIAAQAVAVAWATASGLPGDRVLVQAPFELPTSPEEVRLLVAGILVRRRLHPMHPIVLSEPADAGGPAWRAGLPLCLLAAGDARMVVHRGDGTDFAPRAEETRAAAALAALIPQLLATGDGRVAPSFSAAVLETAAALAGDALSALEAAERDGWEELAGSR